MPITLTPESPEQLRKRLKEYEGVELEFGLHPILQGLARALDRVEELERELADRVDHYKKLHSYWDAATDELSALKAKVERLKHHVEHYCGECQEEILAILDGKEG